MICKHTQSWLIGVGPLGGGRGSCWKDGEKRKRKRMKNSRGRGSGAAADLAVTQKSLKKSLLIVTLPEEHEQ